MCGCIWLVGCSLPPDMSHSAAVGPYEEPRTPAAGTLAVGDPPVLTRPTAWNTLTNPRPATTSVVNEGAELYRVYCSICHGPDGSGEGTVSEYFRRIPDLRAPYVRRYQDGRFYTIIREGRRDMPSYAASLSVDERWAVVHYLRTLGSAP